MWLLDDTDGNPGSYLIMALGISAALVVGVVLQIGAHLLIRRAWGWLVHQVRRWRSVAASNEESEPMTEKQWEELFQSLDIEHWGVNDGHVLCYRGRSIQMYWCRNRDVGIYFSAGASGIYPDNLWERIDPSLVKEKDRRRQNVTPWPGKESDAFRDRLSRLNA